MKEVKTIHSLMPLPTEMIPGKGELVIDHDFRIGLSGCVEPLLERATARLVERLTQITGIPMHRDLAKAKEDAILQIHVDEKVAEVQSATEDESYTLDITAKIAVLRSRKLYGALRGIETFVQLVRLSDCGFVVPAVRIKDRPRFPWRGLLIDVTRHWIPPAVIKRNLEAMASVKLNVLHWHLTDDQGFRIESYRYPKLHELGSDGLFYTQDDVREIVEFASDRGIRVLPEFDMPGHTSSWFVGYPDLASAPGPYRIERNWGGHEATMDPTREETYEFISNFLSEMVTLFPDLYVHVGGDEVSGKQWQGNRDILKFMVSEGIKDTRHLQAYFNRRLHGIINKLGREMVGWDPILHADLPEKSIVQSVRGQKWLAEAVCNGFQGVAGSEYYLDLLRPAEFHYRSDPLGAEAAELTTEQQVLIVGGEASMWTEFANAENIDSRIWPRAAAVAERLWSSRDVTDIEDMYRRLAAVSRLLDWTGITHKSGPRRMLYRLTDYDSIKALSTLADILQPTFDIRWKNQGYTSMTPLNRLVDATVPESETARRFSRMVEQFIMDISDIILCDALTTQLRVWRSNHIELEQDIKRSPLLTELMPLSINLSQVAEIGLQSIAVLNTGKAMAHTEWERQKIQLKNAIGPIAELILLIVPDIQKLNKAVRTVR